MIEKIVKLEESGYDSWVAVEFPDVNDGDFESEQFENEEDAIEYLKEEGFKKLGDLEQGGQVWVKKSRA